MEDGVPAGDAAVIRLPPPEPVGNPQLERNQLNDDGGDNSDEDVNFERPVADGPSLSASKFTLIVLFRFTFANNLPILDTYQDRFVMKERIVAFVAANKKYDLMEIVEAKFRKTPDVFRMAGTVVQYRSLDSLTQSLEINNGEVAKTWQEGNNPGRTNYSNRTAVLKKVSQIEIFAKGPLSKKKTIERLPVAFQGSTAMTDVSLFADNMLTQNTATKDRMFN
jgi:hypothetical protein